MQSKKLLSTVWQGGDIKRDTRYFGRDIYAIWFLAKKEVNHQQNVVSSIESKLHLKTSRNFPKLKKIKKQSCKI